MTIMIRDLEVSKELDRKAMHYICGGNPHDGATLDMNSIGWSHLVGKRGIGTFIEGDQVVHRYRNVYIVEILSEPYSEAFIGPISTWPVPGSGP